MLLFYQPIQFWRLFHQETLHERLSLLPLSRNKKIIFLAGFKKLLSVIVQVIKAGTERLGRNAMCRTFDVAKTPLINWEARFAGIKKMLLFYALLHAYLKLIIEGDERYTKVKKNDLPDASPGWTVVFMDRSSRFLWELRCDRKDRTRAAPLDPWPLEKLPPKNISVVFL